MNQSVISFRSVNALLGPILFGLAGLMLIPCVTAWYLNSPDLRAFLITNALTALCALVLTFLMRPSVLRLRVREMFLLTSLAWISVGFFGALPFILSHIAFSFTDAVFESVSAITTTGATVLTGLDAMPRDILLWRSMLQWIGGIGIIALGAAVLPFLRIGGMKLFQTESSDFSEKALPQARRILARLLVIYLFISFACAMAYGMAGMSLFDAVNHAMTTVSTGGFSTHDKSLGYFESAHVEAVAMVFMIIAALPFMLLLPVMRGRFAPILRDGQVRTFFVALAVAIAGLVLWLMHTGQETLFLGLRRVAFGIVSIVTTTGYVSFDYTTWAGLAIPCFFFLTFVGGCSGSTSGGVKIFRFNVAFMMMIDNMKHLLHPTALLPRTMQGRPLGDEIMRSVMAFAMAFAISFAVLAVVLASVGNDFLTSTSGAAAALANVGPGLGDTIGPSGKYADLNDISKWVLAAGMLLGRLEIFSLIVLLAPGFWRY